MTSPVEIFPMQWKFQEDGTEQMKNDSACSGLQVLERADFKLRQG